MLNNFYKVLEVTSDGNAHAVTVEVNPEHAVFGGHFPGNPVMPGVCMVQIIKELTERIGQKNVQLQSLSNVKFMALINPEKTPVLRLDLDIAPTESGFKVKNTTYFNDTLALKLSGNFKTV